MTRILAPYLLGAFLFAALVGGAFYAGARWATQDARETTLERERAIDEATRNDDGVSWFDRLRGQ